MRMLTLQHRSLVSDRPLPLQSSPSADRDRAAPVLSARTEHETRVHGHDADGYPTGQSPWLAKFNAAEHVSIATQYGPPAAEMEQLFTLTVRALHAGEFPRARDLLQRVCIGSDMLSRAWLEQHQNISLAASRNQHIFAPFRMHIRKTPFHAAFAAIRLARWLVGIPHRARA